MGFDRFLIAPFEAGLQNDLSPWLLPENAFAELKNAYVRHGGVNKRFGSRLMGNGTGETAQLNSRVRVYLTDTDGAGAAAGNIPLSTGNIGQAFSIGSDIFTVYQATGAVYSTGSGTGTFDTTTGAYTFTGASAAAAIYWYPSTPIMAYFNYETKDISNTPLYAFDTNFVYSFSSNSWLRNGTTVWHGSDSDFFWSTNWTGSTVSETYTFVSNFHVTNKTGAAVGATDDPIYYFNGASTWTAFSPEITAAANVATNKVFTAKIVVPFRNRLLLFNTIEQDAAGTTNTQYQNRCRFSHNGSPIVPPVAAGTFNHPWLEPNQTYISGAATYKASGGGYIDAPTKEAIVSAEFIRDRLIVHFEDSVWELAYNGNHILPFVWQQLNTEIGSESTFSSVGFDKHILTVGTTGIHSCNGVNVDRIDEKIPDDIFKLRYSNNGRFRVSGIRDFNTELVYWAFPDTNAGRYSETFPNKVLVYNYKEHSWAYNDDTFTTFGYFDTQPEKTWADMGDMTWEEADFAWDEGVNQVGAKKIVAGNQQGFCFVVEPTLNSNAQSMQITNLTAGSVYTRLVIINHTLKVDDYVYITNINGAVLADGIYKVINVTDEDTVDIDIDSSGTYTGGGTVSRVSEVDIKSKEFNPYIKQGRDVHLSKISFYVSSSTAGEVTVDYYVSSSGLPLINEGNASGVLFGDSPNVLDLSPYFLEPLEYTQQRYWHSLSFEAEGENVQIRIHHSESQMKDPAISLSGFTLHGMILYTLPTSERVR